MGGFHFHRGWLGVLLFGFDLLAGIFICIFNIKPKMPELFEEKDDKYYY
jgi:hypothetical protein